MTAAEHIAARPSWRCVACDAAWPCGPARAALLSELGPTQLAMYLWSTLEEAVGDLPGLAAVDAFERFLAWSRTGR